MTTTAITETTTATPAMPSALFGHGPFAYTMTRASLRGRSAAHKCSQRCPIYEAAPQCAEANGACNGMGFCMCPPMGPPAHDAGPCSDAAGLIDAP